MGPPLSRRCSVRPALGSLGAGMIVISCPSRVKGCNCDGDWLCLLLLELFDLAVLKPDFDLELDLCLEVLRVLCCGPADLTLAGTPVIKT